jgi:clan AA aspartic protease (TIGR02281 family)
MRTVVVFIWAALASGTAAAFECTGVTLPSTLVICSDAELMRLADERQEAFHEARARIGEARWPALWEDQKAWVRSYATACGVPPDSLPPPFPVPTSIKACFTQAALARIAYLRSYGVTARSATVSPSQGAAGRDRIGPSFDCGKDATYPLSLLLCADPDLSRLDLRFGQAYWALYQQLGPAGQPQLRAENQAFFDQVQEQCGLPKSGALIAEVWHSRDCVRSAYQRMREVWLSRLTGPARQEAIRSPEEHLALQQALQILGFLPPSPIDGVYGPVTRSSILAWQSARGLATTGLLGDADANLIKPEAIASRSTERADAPSPRPATEDITLKKVGGVYVVAVRINQTITLDFIVDSGASDVLIPADVAMTLARAGTIASGDFIGDREYQTADGSTLKSSRFILRELRVGTQVVQNVVASIGSVRGEPLLGQSFLAHFRSWSIDNDRHVIVLGQTRQ